MTTRDNNLPPPPVGLGLFHIGPDDVAVVAREAEDALRAYFEAAERSNRILPPRNVDFFSWRPKVPYLLWAMPAEGYSPTLGAVDRVLSELRAFVSTLGAGSGGRLEGTYRRLIAKAPTILCECGDQEKRNLAALLDLVGRHEFSSDSIQEMTQLARNVPKWPAQFAVEVLLTAAIAAYFEGPNRAIARHAEFRERTRFVAHVSGSIYSNNEGGEPLDLECLLLLADVLAWWRLNVGLDAPAGFEQAALSLANAWSLRQHNVAVGYFARSRLWG